MSNQLKDQSSPYLLQHAENPVDWYPWGKAAFEKAEREDKPIFLSIGYSTCHWCHVMARESFEDQRTAEILNRYFVSIKVDREERPDIDSVYMSVCQALTGSGGWPMSIFMTSEQKPFFAGTYFPPVSRYGTAGFPEILSAIAGKWRNDREELLTSAERILAHVSGQEDHRQEDHQQEDYRQGDHRREQPGKDGRPREPDIHRAWKTLPEKAAELFSGSFDEKYGGFGQAPKFPTPHNLIFLTLYSRLRQQKTALEQTEVTLDRMRGGGIFDQIGYGFSRYSTDRYFLVPHFEKMLYDNALLILAYCAAYKATGHESLLDTAEKTAEYLFREMTGKEGEFYSAQDADSEGEEGKFYVWDYEEVLDVLGAEKGEPFCDHFDITREGNFEGRNIPNLLHSLYAKEGSEAGQRDENPLLDGFEDEKKALYDYRRSRVALHLDDKILTAWNALMISALSVLYRVTGKRTYLLAAEKTAQFIERNLSEGNLLYVSCRNGIRSVKGFLDEYAYYAAAMISLYEVSRKPCYLRRAKQLCLEARKQFEDEKGGYFLYGKENSSLIIRPRESYDGALPSGNSVMAYCLVRLSQLTRDEDILMDKAAEKQLLFMAAEAEHYPAGYCMYLTALLFYENPPQKITVVPAPGDQMDEILARLPLYADVKMSVNSVKNSSDSSDSEPFVSGAEAYPLLNEKTTYYVCKNHTCFPPTNQAPE